ncbi:MAG TPA: xanthine dehydrogenase family protein subunit M [Symbiobacteriaceae bacterium]|nr:xanthine dehydrogenase family protein subunit M [Symbiobacteriaceae bacterium]
MQDGAVTVRSPVNLREALSLLAEGGEAARPLAGGTDAMGKMYDGVWRPQVWINLQRLRPALAYIRMDGDRLEIGALTTFSALLASPMVMAGAPLLGQAARTIGGPQIRNMGTLGGNLGTASPAADSLPALYALEAEVRLASLDGERTLPIGEFMLGPGSTALKPGELITAVRFAVQQPGELCTYEKLGLRAAHAIAVASVALRLAPRAGDAPGRFAMARVALGAVAPTVVRAPLAEAALLANPVSADAALRAAAGAREAASPITDGRASAEYRRAMAGNLLQRGLIRLLGPDVAPGAHAS